MRKVHTKLMSLSCWILTTVQLWNRMAFSLSYMEIDHISSDITYRINLMHDLKSFVTTIFFLMEVETYNKINKTVFGCLYITFSFIILAVTHCQCQKRKSLAVTCCFWFLFFCLYPVVCMVNVISEYSKVSQMLYLFHLYIGVSLHRSL